jgi:hypothetical protein
MLSSRRNRRFDSAIDRMCGSSIYYLDSTMYDAQHNLVQPYLRSTYGSGVLVIVGGSIESLRRIHRKLGNECSSY